MLFFIYFFAGFWSGRCKYMCAGFVCKFFFFSSGVVVLLLLQLFFYLFFVLAVLFDSFISFLLILYLFRFYLFGQSRNGMFLLPSCCPRIEYFRTRFGRVFFLFVSFFESHVKISLDSQNFQLWNTPI